MMSDKREFKVLLAPEAVADAAKCAEMQTALGNAFEVFATAFLGKTAEEAVELAAAATDFKFDAEPAKKRDVSFYLPIGWPFVVRFRTLVDGKMQLSVILRQTHSVTDKQVRFFADMVGPVAAARGLKARSEADVFGRAMAVSFGVSKFVDAAPPATLTLKDAFGILFEEDAEKVLGYAGRLCLVGAEELASEMTLHAAVSETKFKGPIIDALRLARGDEDAKFHSRFFVSQWKHEETLLAVELNFKIDLRVASVALAKKLFDFIGLVDYLKPFLYNGPAHFKTMVYAVEMDGKLPPPPAEPAAAASGDAAPASGDAAPASGDAAPASGDAAPEAAPAAAEPAATQ